MHDYLHIGRATDLTNKKDRRLYRLLEIMPGFLAWATLFLVVVLSYFIPVFIPGHAQSFPPLLRCS